MTTKMADRQVGGGPHFRDLKISADLVFRIKFSCNKLSPISWLLKS